MITVSTVLPRVHNENSEGECQTVNKHHKADSVNYCLWPVSILTWQR